MHFSSLGRWLARTRVYMFMYIVIWADFPVVFLLFSHSKSAEMQIFSSDICSTEIQFGLSRLPINMPSSHKKVIVKNQGVKALS